jgi:hypothetical protein
MPTQPIIYALDLTGQLGANRITSERRFNNREQTVRTITPQFAPFYTATVVVKDSATQQLLEKGVDYKCVEPVGMAIQESGQEICRSIVIVNGNTGPNWDIDYSTVGGNYIQDFSSLQTLIDNLSDDSRPLSWPSVINRPLSYDPAMHLHNLGEGVGFEYLVTTLETLSAAVRLGDQTQIDAVLGYIDQQINLLKQIITSGSEGLLGQSLVIAQGAANRAAQAITTLGTTQTSLQSVSALVDELSMSVNALMTQSALADSVAVTLLQQYPAAYAAFNAASSLNYTPSLTLEGPISYTPTGAIVPIDNDWAAVNNDGQLLTPQGNGTIPTTAMASLTLTTQRDATGAARLNISLKTYDRRATTLLTGQFTSECTFWLLPLRFEDDSNDLVPISGVSNRYTLAITPVDGSSTPATFQVVGVDGSDASLVAADSTANANKIAQYLLETKPDYNVKNYGSVVCRRAVKITLPAGTELNISFGIAALQAADIEKRVSLRFRHTCTISRGERVNNVTTNAVVASATEVNRVRCISATF